MAFLSHRHHHHLLTNSEACLDHARLHTCEPVSTHCMGCPVSVFQKRMQRSAVPPPLASSPWWWGDHAMAEGKQFAYNKNKWTTEVKYDTVISLRCMNNASYPSLLHCAPYKFVQQWGNGGSTQRACCHFLLMLGTGCLETTSNHTPVPQMRYTMFRIFKKNGDKPTTPRAEVSNPQPAASCRTQGHSVWPAVTCQN